ncbi:MAG: UDP-glucose 4-epimerase GalE [Pseudomonadota bacterium]
MTILITGGAGYIGSHFAWHLFDAAQPFVVLDDLSTGVETNLPANTTLIKGDLADDTVLDEIFTKHAISAVVHFAGSIVVPESVENPLKYYSNNTAKSAVLFAAMVRHGVKNLIFSSTAAVYGIPDVAVVSETTPKAPISPYGTSKLMTEQIIADVHAAHGLNAVVLRYFNVAGADPQGRTGQSFPKATHLIKVACEAALGKRARLDIYGTDYSTPDGTGIRDYIHVSDLAAAHKVCLTFLNTNAGVHTFNCGYGRGFSVLEVIESVKRASGVDFAVNRTDRRAGDPPQLISSPEQLHAQTGWRPHHDNLDTIVSTALAWERKLS